MSPAASRVRSLTALLLKADYTDPATALKSSEHLGQHSLRDSVPFLGTLYVRPPSEKSPWWVEFLEGAIDESLGPLENATTAAVLFVEVEGRILAFTFGYGRNLLKPECFERDFGLKVALNTVDADLLRSVDVRTFEELTVHTRRQTSRGSSLDTFGLDISQDQLRAVTGQPRDTTFAKRLTGADSLKMAVKVGIEGLGQKAREMLGAYVQDDYKERFGWIDYLKGIRDPTAIETLDTLLLDVLRNGNLQRLHLAPPEPVDWHELDGFRYSTDPDREVRHDIDVEEWRETVEAPGDLTLEDIKRARVEVMYTGQEQPVDKWSVYECVVFETEMDERFFVLTGERWFEVARDFANSVTAYVAALPQSGVSLPDSPSGEKEEDYNRRVAEGGSEFALMDRKLIQYGGGYSRIEFCDLLSQDRQFIHVKRKVRSATLSHLFAQGTVPAEAFLRDPEFRRLVREVVADVNGEFEGLIPEDRPNPQEYEIVYAIIAAPGGAWPQSLPFFSQLHLRQAAQRLQTLGYNVSTKFVPES